MLSRNSKIVSTQNVKISHGPLLTAHTFNIRPVLAFFVLIMLVISGQVFGHYSGGSGIGSDPFLISNANDIAAIRDNPGHWDKHFKLISDIDMSEAPAGELNMIGRYLVRDPWSLAIDNTEKKLYWSDTQLKRIYRTNLDGSNLERIVDESVARPTHIALDETAGKLYWADANEKSIRRSNLDGSNIETIASTGGRSVSSITLDTTENRVYWSRMHSSRIYSTKFNGTGQNDFLTTSGLPVGLVIDDDGGYIYWVDERGSQIGRTKLDGSQEETIITGLSHPTGIALDTVGGKIYWGQYQGMYSANLDGSDQKKLAESNHYGRSIALEFPGPEVYWTNPSSSKICKLGYGWNNWFITNWFNGVFDGNGHQILNFSLTQDRMSGVGFFGRIESHGVCKDLTLTGPNVSAPESYMVALLVGFNGGVISNCSIVNGFVEGDKGVGGLAGRGGGNITDCKVSASVFGRASVGGLAGEGAGDILRSFCEGEVYGDVMVGGLIGEATSGSLSIINSYSSVTVSGDEKVGGIAGTNGSTMENCYSTGEVSGTTDVGGLIGYMWEDLFDRIGIRFPMPDSDIDTVKNCFWDVDSSNIGVVGDDNYGAIGKSTNEMQTQSMYEDAGWDFETPIWVMCSEGEYPVLAWECNRAPVADAGDDIVVYAGVDGLAVVKLDGSGSFDADKDELEYFWYGDGNELIAEGVDPNVVFAIGSHVIDLIVNDGTANSEPDSVLVTVIEAVEAWAYVFPRVLNATSRGRYVIARMQLPDGVSKDDVADDSLRLVIGDVVIESIRQRGIGYGRRQYVFGFFDRGKVIAQAVGKESLNITIAGELVTGECIYGEDTTKIVKSQASGKRTPRRRPARNNRGGRRGR